MDFTVEVSKTFNLSPFDVMRQEKDDVIMLINYFIQKGERTDTESKTETVKKRNGKKVERVRVNDKTASGGWF